MKHIIKYGIHFHDLIQLGGLKMKKQKLLAIMLTGMMMVSMTMTGCKSSSNNSTSGAPDKDQHITVGIPVANVKTLDASKGTDAYSAYILQESMEALAREEIKDGKDQFVPDGATGWEVSSDGKTWTIHIRDSKWSDGEAVTAEQYEYAIKRTLAKDTASQYAYLLINASIKGAAEYNAGSGKAEDVGIKATDKSTLVITLDKPCAYFEKLLSNKLFIAQRKDLVEKNGAAYGTKAETLAYNGPFKIATFANGSKVELVKNDQYWDKDNVKLDKLTFLFMNDENSRMNAFMSGQIDRVAAATGNWKDKFAQTGKFDFNNTNIPATSYMFFNTKNKYFANAKIRKAFSLILDRADYVKVVRQGIGQPAYGWVPYSLQIGNDQFRDKIQEELKGNNEDAKQLLVAGLKEIGADPDPAKMTVNYLEASTDELAKNDGDYFINLVKTKLGATVNVNYMEWAQANDNINEGKYDISSMAWGGDYNDPMTFFDMWESNAGVMVNYWANKDYDALIEDAKDTMDQAKRLDDFTKAEKMLLIDEAVISPMFYQQSPVFSYKYLKGVQDPLFAPVGVEWKYAYTSGR